mmetsp:Transcript_58446/g.126956  ORF Transcript_58446/g.126956 Transcript_58446/m.126956 type:complete len:238 (-) Transcript_58446:291-1004(-)
MCSWWTLAPRSSSGWVAVRTLLRKRSPWSEPLPTSKTRAAAVPMSPLSAWRKMPSPPSLRPSSLCGAPTCPSRLLPRALARLPTPPLTSPPICSARSRRTPPWTTAPAPSSAGASRTSSWQRCRRTSTAISTVETHTCSATHTPSPGPPAKRPLSISGRVRRAPRTRRVHRRCWPRRWTTAWAARPLRCAWCRGRSRPTSDSSSEATWSCTRAGRPAASRIAPRATRMTRTALRCSW